MRSVIFPILLLLAQSVIAQDSAIYSTRRIDAGRRGYYVPAVRVDVAPYRISRYEIDRTAQRLYIYTDDHEQRTGPDKKGNGVICYDLIKMQPVYEYHFSGGSDYIGVYGEYIIRDQSTGVIVKEAATDAKLSFNRGDYRYFNYRYHTLITALGIAYDITTGKVLWRMMVDKKIPWHEFHQLSDENIIVASDGLYNLYVQKRAAMGI